MSTKLTTAAGNVVHAKGADAYGTFTVTRAS